MIWCGQVLGYGNEQGCSNFDLRKRAKFPRMARRATNLLGEEADSTKKGVEVEKAQNLRRARDLIERGMNHVALIP